MGNESGDRRKATKAVNFNELLMIVPLFNVQYHSLSTPKEAQGVWGLPIHEREAMLDQQVIPYSVLQRKAVG